MSKLFWNFSNYGNNLEMSIELARTCFHSGDCENDVKRAIELPEIKSQVEEWDKESLKKELAEQGAWTDNELNDHEMNIVRWVWISAGDIVENFN